MADREEPDPLVISHVNSLLKGTSARAAPGGFSSVRVSGWLDKSEYRPGGVASTVMQALFAAGSRKRRFCLLIGQYFVYAETREALIDPTAAGGAVACDRAIDVWDLWAPGVTVTFPSEAGPRGIVLQAPRHLLRPAMNAERVQPYLLVAPTTEEFLEWSAAIAYQVRVAPRASWARLSAFSAANSSSSREVPRVILCTATVAHQRGGHAVHEAPGIQLMAALATEAHVDVVEERGHAEGRPTARWLPAHHFIASGDLPDDENDAGSAGTVTPRELTKCLWRGGITSHVAPQAALVDFAVVKSGDASKASTILPSYWTHAHGGPVPSFALLRRVVKAGGEEAEPRWDVAPFAPLQELTEATAVLLRLVPLDSKHDAEAHALLHGRNEPTAADTVGDGCHAAFALLVVDQQSGKEHGFLTLPAEESTTTDAESLRLRVASAPDGAGYDAHGAMALAGTGESLVVAVARWFNAPPPQLTLTTDGGVVASSAAIAKEHVQIAFLGANRAGKSTVIASMLQGLKDEAGTQPSDATEDSVRTNDGSPVATVRLEWPLARGVSTPVGLMNVSSSCATPVVSAYTSRATLLVVCVDLREPYSLTFARDVLTKLGAGKRSQQRKISIMAVCRNSQHPMRSVAGPTVQSFASDFAIDTVLFDDSEQEPGSESLFRAVRKIVTDLVARDTFLRLTEGLFAWPPAVARRLLALVDDKSLSDSTGSSRDRRIDASHAFVVLALSACVMPSRAFPRLTRTLTSVMRQSAQLHGTGVDSRSLVQSLVITLAIVLETGSRMAYPHLALMRERLFCGTPNFTESVFPLATLRMIADRAARGDNNHVLERQRSETAIHSVVVSLRSFGLALRDVGVRVTRDGLAAALGAMVAVSRLGSDASPDRSATAEVTSIGSTEFSAWWACVAVRQGVAAMSEADAIRMNASWGSLTWAPVSLLLAQTRWEYGGLLLGSASGAGGDHGEDLASSAKPSAVPPTPAASPGSPSKRRVPPLETDAPNDDQAVADSSNPQEEAQEAASSACARCGADFNFTRLRYACPRCLTVNCKSCLSDYRFEEQTGHGAGDVRVFGGNMGAKPRMSDMLCRTCLDRLGGDDTTVQKWQRDEDATACAVCAKPFSLLARRKHHCRRCGTVVCGSCSSGRRRLKAYGVAPQRVCDPCKSKIDQPESPRLSRQMPANMDPKTLTTDAAATTATTAASRAPTTVAANDGATDEDEDPLDVIAPWLALERDFDIQYTWQDMHSAERDAELIRQMVIPPWDEARDARYEYRVLQPGVLPEDAALEDAVDDSDPDLWPAPPPAQ